MSRSRVITGWAVVVTSFAAGVVVRAADWPRWAIGACVVASLFGVLAGFLVIDGFGPAGGDGSGSDGGNGPGGAI
ncbi:hypothetical protein ACIRBX_02350 [Kitasatospora sp. NPDC096147]|uniref:hypothetical protein n=1 Tax=Kitasatospora sp. NPDC096147 TaxID=3364093 RepID=UPI003813013F